MSKKFVYGVGINDADYNIGITDTVDGKNKIVWMCPFYIRWRGMLSRCYYEKYNQKWPTYIGCSVCPEWFYFSKFKNWMETQDWEGKELDKDILFPGNKVYSPEACVFVEGRLNLFLTNTNLASGPYPTGVSWHKATSMFVAQCNNPTTGKYEHLGLFDNPEVAHQVWKAKKHEHALAYAEQQADPRVAEALRKRYL